MEALGVVLGFGDPGICLGQELPRAAYHGPAGGIGLTGGDGEISLSHGLFGRRDRGATRGLFGGLGGLPYLWHRRWSACRACFTCRLRGGPFPERCGQIRLRQDGPLRNGSSWNIRRRRLKGYARVLGTLRSSLNADITLRSEER